MGVKEEIQRLDTLLTKRYRFTTHNRLLPSRGAAEYLTRELLNFHRERGPGDLLILYYGGHAASSETECTWKANLKPDSPRLNWLSVQNLLLEHDADVLMILDCCFAAHAARGSSKGDNWFLAASAGESLATGVSYFSFTSAMTRRLERRANIYEDKGEPFSVQTIHREMILHDDLSITPFITRLTDRECPPTDLTPLPHFRKPPLRSAQTAPLHSLPPQFSGPPIPHRPRGPHATSSMPERSQGGNGFLGLTCLYQSPDGEPSVDLVFVHGTDGHAIDSFASHPKNITGEASWLCAKLPQVLEAAGIFSRLMIFDWAANAWLDVGQDTGTLGKASEDLRSELECERSGSKGRPLVFIGHGVGGLLIKQVVIDIINFGVVDENFENQINACLFFAVPGHPENPAIKSLSHEFNQISEESSISTRCFYEVQKTADSHIVPKQSNMPDGDMSHPIDANFRDNVRLAKLEPNFQQKVLEIMRDTIQEKLSPKPVPKLTPKREEILENLSKYDTVFLVDDSSSMQGHRWVKVSKVLAKIASIAIKHDTDGVDIRFFNKVLEDEERLNLDSSKKVMDLFKRIDPKGPTPTGDVLETELMAYLAKFRKSKVKTKRLNLIVLTDGEPDDVNMVEDAIVKCAKELEELKAHSLQVGVQFVQIGGDKEASEFLRRLDDDLMGTRKLDRDVSIHQRTQIRC